jgi:hypothetical protein
MRSSWGNSFAKQEKKIGYVVNKLRLGDIEALGRCKKIHRLSIYYMIK